MASLLAASSLSAATLIVGPGGYATIQQAVEAAAAGDLIRVTNGVYGTTIVDKWVRIRSMNGPHVTFVEGTMRLSSGASVFGFTLRNGAYHTSVVECWFGATNAFLTNCVISGGRVPGANGADGFGGGAFACTLHNCLLTDNWASYGGGGAAFCTLYNCTVAGNSAQGYGGGTINCTLYNSIVCSNTAHLDRNCSGSSLNYCFTDSDPLFVDYAKGNFRLQSNSPCINAGNNAYVATHTDLDGRARVAGGTVDLGPYEVRPGVSGAFIGWMEYYGLRTDGSEDGLDRDGDGLSNWQEWVCGTCPTNSLSVLRLLLAAPAGPNATVTWQSVAGVNYSLERKANLQAPFTLVASNLTGQAGTTIYVDTDVTGAGSFFYRVGVKCP